MTFHRCCTYAMIALPCLAGAVRAASPVMINSPLPANSNLYNPRFTPDGRHVVYFADQDEFGTIELFIAPAGGGQSIQLNDDFVAGGSASPSEIIITPDSSTFLYVADQHVDNRHELYAASLGSSFAPTLSGMMPAGGFVDASTLGISPDGSRVVFAANQESPLQFDLYSVDIEGGTPVRLSLPSGSSNSFYGSYFSPDGADIAFVSDLDTANSPELYIVPATGGSPLRLNTPVSAGGSVEQVRFTADGNHLIYVASDDGTGGDELFVVPRTGGTPTMLNAPLVAGGRVDEYEVSPDGSELIYIADQDIDGVDELYITSVLGGGSPVKLNGTLAPGGDVDDDGFRFSPDGNFVVFTAEVNDGSTNELFIVPRTGGTPVQLNGPLVAGGDVSDSSRATLFSHDGSRVVYAADQDVIDTRELYSVSSTGGPTTKLNGELNPGGSIQSGSVRLHAEDDRIIYTADARVDEIYDLYIVPIEGGEAVRISESLEEGYNVLESEFSPDGDRVLFTAWNSSFQTNVYTRVIRQRFASPAGFWDDDDVWEHDEVPDAAMHIIVDAASVVTVRGPEGQGDYEPESAYKVELGGGPANSSIHLESGAALATDKGLSIYDKGVLRGDGQVNGDVVVDAGGEVRAATAQHLQFIGGTFSNSGRVEAIGSAANHAEIEFDSAVTNSAGTGLIAGTHARLRFDGGLDNQGSLALSVGESHVFGDIDNTGKIVVTGGAAVTFYDDIVQNGTLTISKVGNVSSAAIFLGDVSGSGTMAGGGDVFLEGDLRPGNSPGAITFNNNIFLGPETTVDIEIGGDLPGVTFDTIQVNGELSLNGELNVSLIDGFLPDGGSMFEVIASTEDLSGAFSDVQLPMPRGGISWDIIYGSGSVALVSSGIRGDYNFDGTVDASDYVVWRKLFASNNPAADGSGDGIVDEADRLVWSAYFGGTAGSGSAAGLAPVVPEPGTLLTACVAALAVGCIRRGRRDYMA